MAKEELKQALSSEALAKSTLQDQLANELTEKSKAESDRARAAQLALDLAEQLQRSKRDLDRERERCGYRVCNIM